MGPRCSRYLPWLLVDPSRLIQRFGKHDAEICSFRNMTSGLLIQVFKMAVGIWSRSLLDNVSERRDPFSIVYEPFDFGVAMRLYQITCPDRGKGEDSPGNQSIVFIQTSSLEHIVHP